MTFSTSLKASPVSSLEPLGLTKGEVELVGGEIEAFLGFHQAQGVDLNITDLTLESAAYVLGKQIRPLYTLQHIAVIGGKSRYGYSIPLPGRREIFIHINPQPGIQKVVPEKVQGLLS